MRRALGVNAVALVAALAGALAVPAVAGSNDASGTGIGIPVPQTQQQAGSNTIYTGEGFGSLDGTLVGTFTESFLWVVHADGSGNVVAHGTFTGTVGTCGTVTVPFELTLQGTLAAYTGQASSNAPGIGYHIIFSGGNGTFTYSGTYHC